MTNDALYFYQKVRDYLNVYLPNQRGSSPNTVKAYREALNAFIDHIASPEMPLKQISFNCISRNAVEGFLDWLEQDRGYSISSRNQRLAAIKSFMKYASERDKTLMVINLEVAAITKKKNANPHEIEFFSEAALATILAQPDRSRRNGQRDLVFLILLYDTGARVQEVLDLRIQDISLDGNSPYVTVTGKGRKMRNIPIMEKTRDHLIAYCKKFHPSGQLNDYLFYIDRKGLRSQMSADNVGKFVAKYGRQGHAVSIEVPEHLYPHMFRHSRAMHLYRNGMPLALVAEWLGHSKMDTTRQYYANADTKMKQEAIEKATSKLNPLISAETDLNWEDDEELLKKLYGLK